MDHVAIMRKSWGLTHKILTGRKKIESRWYKAKYAPWNRIKSGDAVYFKDSGEPVTIKTKVSKVLQFEDLNPKKVKSILNKYGGVDGIAVENIPRFISMFKDKKYCMLIFLKNAQKVHPFDIDKTGFGMMAAWLTIPDIADIKKW